MDEREGVEFAWKMIAEQTLQHVANMKAAAAEKDADTVYKEAVNIFKLAQSSHDLGFDIEPFQKVFDMLGFVIYVEGKEIKWTKKTEASTVLFSGVKED